MFIWYKILDIAFCIIRVFLFNINNLKFLSVFLFHFSVFSRNNLRNYISIIPFLMQFYCHNLFHIIIFSMFYAYQIIDVTSLKLCSMIIMFFNFLFYLPSTIIFFMKVLDFFHKVFHRVVFFVQKRVFSHNQTNYSENMRCWMSLPWFINHRVCRLSLSGQNIDNISTATSLC